MESLQSGQESQVLALKCLICTVSDCNWNVFTEAEFHHRCRSGLLVGFRGGKAGRQLVLPGMRPCSEWEADQASVDRVRSLVHSHPSCRLSLCPEPQEEIAAGSGPGAQAGSCRHSSCLTCAQGKLQLELLSAVFVPVQLCNGDGIIKEYKEAR